ncbi:hypothetical protein BGW36DRAFT_57335 [Talaromyces proteolyticus]|uniref:Ankyrin repeat protein n=1 Tax=Talaromyces proteolyticus TaxID=1131652 RepID=A0AAD4PTB0_9EURO|nr:uncharacterized protein BGW36DRAFT_57335 [Talaromyces proteolyticus]KAH8690561.1 hypothetical protein BGW36DRAFT_57335 [Talaromyces proteolyticus]
MYKECHPPEKASYFQEKCKYLFGEEVWTRHQYQMSHTSVAHRRFIRPICQRIALSDTDDNMMMVLPYIHWETNSGRKQMTDVIVEAMKRHLKDPQPLSTSKGLNEALEELEKIRKSKFMDPDDDATSGYASDYSYYDSYTRTSSVSSDGRSRWPRDKVTKETEPAADPDVDWISRVALETLENEVIRARHAPVEKKAEQEERRKKRIQKIVKVAKESRRSDEKLILAYMFDEIPLHFRRTLDQYYYYTLPTTEARDSDQVVSRYFEKTWPEEENENLVLMVDQLWLWILDNDTIVTSFPQRWNKSEEKSEKDPDPNNDSDIVESIIRQIGKQDRRPLTNVFDLAELIVSKCVGTMFEHPDIANEKLRFAEFFEISIGNTNEESKMFNDFTDLFERLAKDDQNISTSDELKKDLRKLFDISEETKLVKEIKDIRDELHIISTILEDQETVLVDMEEAIQAMKARKTEGVEQKKLQTASSYHSLPERVRMHKAVVQGLDKQAEKTYVALKDLLDLKQKQANVSEARTQGKQAAETARQGQTLMLFTVITVFFLPMSFMSSFFSLDIAEFVRNSDGALSLGYVSEIMFTVTVAVVIISLSFAFRWELFVVFITYCKDPLKSFHEGSKKFLKSVQKISTRRRERINIIEEVNKPSSDSDEVVVIEETSPPRRRLRSREYRRGRPSRYSPSPARLRFGRRRDISGLFALFGLRLGTGNVDVVERYSRRRSPSLRTGTGWFGGRQRQRTETVVVEERYGRRGSSSVWGWYGNDDRRSAPRRKKWPPWAWFEKSLAPTRRSRRIHFRDESGQTGLKGIYASFITPLLGWFGISQRAPESRTSVTSSYLSYEGSASSHDRGSNESSDARSR